jgi:hypothetical protein
MTTCQADQKFFLKLNDLVSKKCSLKASCVVNLHDLTSFEWDSVVVFKYTAQSDEMADSTAKCITI